jgi:hypothetical protein
MLDERTRGHGAGPGSAADAAGHHGARRINANACRASEKRDQRRARRRRSRARDLGQHGGREQRTMISWCPMSEKPAAPGALVGRSTTFTRGR